MGLGKESLCVVSSPGSSRGLDRVDRSANPRRDRLGIIPAGGTEAEAELPAEDRGAGKSCRPRVSRPITWVRPGSLTTRASGYGNVYR